VLGPLENADLVGTDLTLAIHDTVLPDLDRTPGALPYLQRLVADGKLGMKSGEGFRKWTPQQQAALRARVLQHLKKARERAALIACVVPALASASSRPRHLKDVEGGDRHGHDKNIGRLR